MLSNIGEIYKGKRDYQQALRYYQEALDLNEKSGNNNYESITVLNIGETYTLTGKFQKGLVYSEKALIIFKKMNFVEGIGRSWANIGRSYIGLKKYDDALSAIETSQRIALQLGLPDLRIQNLLSFSEIYESTGKLSDALDAYRKYPALKDSVFDSDKIKAIAEMQTKYETEKKEQHLMLQQVSWKR
jgi:tetratricopeptide (TPR) repeat protein